MTDAAQHWRDDALCSNLPPAEADRVFFDNPHPGEAFSYCRHCPVIQQCGSFADANSETHGVWAGETAPARRRRLGITVTGDLVGVA